MTVIFNLDCENIKLMKNKVTIFDRGDILHAHCVIFLVLVFTFVRI